MAKKQTKKPEPKVGLIEVVSTACPDCSGRGLSDEHNLCSTCDGTGLVTE